MESERRSGKYQVASGCVLRSLGDPGDVEGRPGVEEVARLDDNELCRTATSEDAEVPGILLVFGEHDVAHVEESCQLADGKIPDAPRVLEEVG